MDETLLTLEVHFDCADRDSDQAELLANSIADQLRAFRNEMNLQIDNVSCLRMSSEDVPDGSKGLGAFIPGAVHAIIGAASVKSILSFLWTRLKGSPIVFDLKMEKRSLKLTVNNADELEKALALAERFVAAK